MSDMCRLMRGEQAEVGPTFGRQWSRSWRAGVCMDRYECKRHDASKSESFRVLDLEFALRNRSDAFRSSEADVVAWLRTGMSAVCAKPPVRSGQGGSQWSSRLVKPGQTKSRQVKPSP